MKRIDISVGVVGIPGGVLLSAFRQGHSNERVIHLSLGETDTKGAGTAHTDTGDPAGITERKAALAAGFANDSAAALAIPFDIVRSEARSTLNH